MFSDIKEFLLSFWMKLKSKNTIKKSAGLIVICLLTVLIPISIAVCYVQFIKGGQKVVSPDISVLLYNADGKLTDSETTQEDIIDASSFAGLFYKMSESKIRAQKPAEFNETPNMSFTVMYNSVSETFKCYFNEDGASSYLMDSSGSFYSPDPLAYSMFLSSPYAEPIYKESSPPILYTPLNDKVISKTTEWTYVLNNGSEKSSSNYETTDNVLTYRIAGAINFSFSRIPDTCTVTVKTLSEDTVFTGSLEKLASLTVEENSELLVSIVANWEKSEKLSSYGIQRYEFKIICVEPSTFDISATEAVGGDILVLSVSNVDNVNSIIYSPLILPTDEESFKNDSFAKALNELYSYQPIFIKDGANAYALLPIPAGIPDTDFTFSLSCGISKAKLTLKLKSSTAKKVDIGEIELTNAQKSEFSRRLFHLKHSKNDVLLINGDFIFPDSYGFAQAQSYNSSINNSFTLYATSYTSSGANGTSVQSANVGIVSEVGYSPLLGNYVIVDHGMGLLTWYCGLSDVGVAEKDIVKKGDSVGRSGSSSMLCENGVNIICSVGGILIDPASLITKKAD